MVAIGPLAALLFDLDGTVVDTDVLHFRAWRQVFAEHGQTIDEQFYKQRVSGRFNPVIVHEHFPHLKESQLEALLARKEQRFLALAGDLEPLPGLDALIGWANQRGLKTAVVTNAPAANARALLSRLGLADAFTTVVLAEHVAAAKPDAAPYLAALERLRIAAAAAVAFEDSPAGIESARAARVPVIGITSTHEASQLRSAGALMAVPDFNARGLRSYLADLAAGLEPER